MRWIYFSVLLTGSLCAIACSRSRAAEDPAPAKAIRLGTVSLAREDEAAKYSAILTPNAQVELAFRVPGYVIELYRTKGADGRRPAGAGSDSRGWYRARAYPPGRLSG